MDLENLIEAITDDTPDEYNGIVSATAIERSYIGASNIGHPCEQAISFRLRGYPTDPESPRLRRIFDSGHHLESVITQHIVDRLEYFSDWKIRDIGGLADQRTYTYFGRVCRAHSDGVLENKDEDILLEIKSANDDSYNNTVRLTLQYAHPSYFDQMQFMMGRGEMKRGLFVMINKNNSKIYAEEIPFDETIYNYLCARAEYIAGGNSEKCSETPADWRCRICSYTTVCWFDGFIQDDMKTCRHCAYSVMDDDMDTFSVCNHPKRHGERVRFDDTYEVKNFTASTCPHFKDYRMKDE